VALLKLRPVTFRYNNDPTDTVQYGLVAEEVAKVYPELVVHGPDGKLLTVRYSMLSTMLLNELQKQAGQSQRQSEQIRQLTARVEQQAEQMAQLKGVFEQAMAARRRTRSLAAAAAFNR
jgi:hypothetical protein